APDRPDRRAQESGDRRVGPFRSARSPPALLPRALPLRPTARDRGVSPEHRDSAALSPHELCPSRRSGERCGDVHGARGLSMQWAVAEIGGRRRYTVPRALYAAGMLAHLYTDMCATKGWPRALHLIPSSFRPASLRRLLGRVPHGIPPERITTFTAFGLEFARRLYRARVPSELTEAHLWAGRRFCELIVAQGLGEAEGVYTYSFGGLELMTYARRQGLSTAYDQLLPP